MKIRQLSLFLENRSGQLRIPCQVLGEAGIDILTMSLADTQQFGILRLIVKDWEKAKRVLEAAGFVVNVTDVLAIDVPDRPGGLASVLESFEKAGLGSSTCTRSPPRASAASTRRSSSGSAIPTAPRGSSREAGVKLAHLAGAVRPGGRLEVGMAKLAVENRIWDPGRDAPARGAARAPGGAARRDGAACVGGPLLPRRARARRRLAPTRSGRRTTSVACPSR